MSQLERILWLDSEVRAGHYPNVQQVMDRFEVSRRTVFDDRDYLVTRLNAPLKYSREKGGWYYKDPTFTLPAVLVNERELVAFWLSQSLSKEYLGSPYADALQDLLKKMIRSLPESLSIDLSKISAKYSLRHRAVPACSPDLLDDIQDAVQHRRVVHIKYWSAYSNETTERDIEPHHLLNAQGEWHCIAWCRLRQAFRQFVLTRIIEWMVTDEQFDIKPDFNADEYLSKGLLKEHGDETLNVVVKFSEYQARWIQGRKWHPSQIEEIQPDGSLILRLNVSGPGEIKRWLLTYGAEVEVLEPASLRDSIVQELKKMKNLYGI